MARQKAAEGGSIRQKALHPVSNFKHEAVVVPEWGETVVIRAMSAGDWTDYRRRSLDFITAAREAAGLPAVAEEGTGESAQLDVSAAQIYALVLVRTLFDESHARIFTDEDVDLVAEAFSPVHDRLVSKAFELSGITAEEEPEVTAGNE